MEEATAMLVDQIEDLIEDGLINLVSTASEVYDAYTTAYHHELNDEDFFGDEAERNSADLHERIERALVCINAKAL
ncbi:MAG: hypothetical protein PHT07_10075 [Paludibacter sp.]|nr:hypothetical protein [Paludibacter sp.]